MAKQQKSRGNAEAAGLIPANRSWLAFQQFPAPDFDCDDFTDRSPCLRCVFATAPPSASEMALLQQREINGAQHAVILAHGLSKKAIPPEASAPPKSVLSFSIEQLAAATSISRSFLYQAIARGDLKARKLGRRTVVLQTDATNWLAGLPIFTARREQQAFAEPEASSPSNTTEFPSRRRRTIVRHERTSHGKR